MRRFRQWLADLIAPRAIDMRPRGWTEATAINVAVDMDDRWNGIEFLILFQQGSWRDIREEFPDEATALDNAWSAAPCP